MDDLFLDIFSHFVQQRSRLCFVKHKKSILKQRLEERRKQLNLADLASYWDHLRNYDQEERILLELLTVNETSFFRNPGQFRYLIERIIPALEAERGEEVMRSWGCVEPPPSSSIMRLRILCAGCSTGEEPYSVAMALCDSLRYPKAWDIEILAGDLSESCIRTASAGYYGAKKLTRLPAGYREMYMERCGSGAVVKDEIKSLIRFCRMNLNDIMNGAPLPEREKGGRTFDVVFCRNVMIYFSFEAQQHLVGTLSRLVAPGGYLFTGDAEPLHLYEHDFEPVREAGCLIYRKTESARNVEAI